MSSNEGMLLGLLVLIVYMYGFIRLTDWACARKTNCRLTIWLLWIVVGFIVTLASIHVLAGPGIESFLRSYDDPVSAEKP